MKRSKEELLNVQSRYMSVTYINPYRLSVSGYVAKAAHFDRSGPVRLTKSGVIFPTPAPKCLLSFWMKLTGDSNSTQILFTSDGAAPVHAYRTTAGALLVWMNNTSVGGYLARILVPSAVPYDGLWHHVLVALDTTSDAANKVAIDGSVVAFTLQYRDGVDASFNINTTYGLSVADSASALNADVSEFFFAPDQWLDLGVAANIAKFRAPATGKPPMSGDLIATTGITPAVYFKFAPTSFGANSGSGGDFSVSGTITVATPP